MNQVTVPVASAWVSKINWTQAIGMVSTIATLIYGSSASIPADTQVQIVAGIQGVQAAATWVFKTWFTTTVTQSSAAKA